ncbi:acyltransferase family protein [Microtetraspora fusca]|uniref:Acyltransferase family protein n=1 Tax=Microtetraspora fusca TaxID=1997 RepID=A0ABW6VKK1_MICFU
MTDTRPSPHVPGANPGEPHDPSEDAPTGVIGRITGEWPPQPATSGDGTPGDAPEPEPPARQRWAATPSGGHFGASQEPPSTGHFASFGSAPASPAESAGPPHSAGPAGWAGSSGSVRTGDPAGSAPAPSGIGPSHSGASEPGAARPSGFATGAERSGSPSSGTGSSAAPAPTTGLSGGHTGPPAFGTGSSAASTSGNGLSEAAPSGDGFAGTSASGNDFAGSWSGNGLVGTPAPGSGAPEPASRSGASGSDAPDRPEESSPSLEASPAPSAAGSFSEPATASQGSAAESPATAPETSADLGAEHRPLPKRRPRSPRADAAQATGAPEPASQGFDYFSSGRPADAGTPPASGPAAPSEQSLFDGSAQGPYAVPTPDLAAHTDDPIPNPFAAPVQDTSTAAPPMPERLPQRQRRGSAIYGQAPTQSMPAVPAAPAAPPAQQQWPELPADPWDPWRRAEHEMPQGLAVPGTAQPPAAAPAAPAPSAPAPDPLPLPAWAQAPQQASPYGPGSASGFGEARPPAGWEEQELEEEPAPRPKRRDPYLDNVKFLLIALVVTSHAIRPTVGADANRALYIFMFSFHMPLFVMISGYLSKNFWNSNAKTNKLVDTFLVPYVIVQFGYAALRVAFGHKWSVSILDPYWLNWYLIALLFWRLSTPVWKRMRYPLLTALVVCLISGLSQLSGDFSIDRVFGLLPFFAMGLVLKPEHFDLLQRTWVKIVGGVTLLVWAVAVYILAPRLKLGLWYFNASYHDLHMTWWYGMGFRLVFLAGVTVICFSVMALVPRRQMWFSELGTRTLYAYLLHGVPVMIGKEMGWLKVSWLEGPLGVLAVLTGSFVLATILCLPITRTLFKWMLEPRLAWLYRRPRKPVEPQPEVQR